MKKYSVVCKRKINTDVACSYLLLINYKLAHEGNVKIEKYIKNLLFSRKKDRDRFSLKAKGKLQMAVENIQMYKLNDFFDRILHVIAHEKVQYLQKKLII